MYYQSVWTCVQVSIVIQKHTHHRDGGWVPYFSDYKTHFFSRKMRPKIDLCLVRWGQVFISKLMNVLASIIRHLYREIVKFASKSWDLASLLVNVLLSYPGIYPNLYIASCDSRYLRCCSSKEVAECSKVMFHRKKKKQWMLKVLRQLW